MSLGEDAPPESRCVNCSFPFEGDLGGKASLSSFRVKEIFLSDDGSPSKSEAGDVPPHVVPIKVGNILSTIFKLDYVSDESNSDAESSKNISTDDMAVCRRCSDTLTELWKIYTDFVKLGQKESYLAKKIAQLDEIIDRQTKPPEKQIILLRQDIFDNDDNESRPSTPNTPENSVGPCNLLSATSGNQSYNGIRGRIPVAVQESPSKEQNLIPSPYSDIVPLEHSDNEVEHDEELISRLTVTPDIHCGHNVRSRRFEGAGIGTHESDNGMSSAPNPSEAVSYSLFSSYRSVSNHMQQSQRTHQMNQAAASASSRRKSSVITRECYEFDSIEFVPGENSSINQTIPVMQSSSATQPRILARQRRNSAKKNSMVISPKTYTSYRSLPGQSFTAAQLVHSRGSQNRTSKKGESPRGRGRPKSATTIAGRKITPSKSKFRKKVAAAAATSRSKMQRMRAVENSFATRETRMRRAKMDRYYKDPFEASGGGNDEDMYSSDYDGSEDTKANDLSMHYEPNGAASSTCQSEALALTTHHFHNAGNSDTQAFGSHGVGEHSSASASYGKLLKSPPTKAMLKEQIYIPASVANAGAANSEATDLTYRAKELMMLSSNAGQQLSDESDISTPQFSLSTSLSMGSANAAALVETLNLVHNPDLIISPGKNPYDSSAATIPEANGLAGPSSSYAFSRAKEFNTKPTSYKLQSSFKYGIKKKAAKTLSEGALLKRYCQRRLKVPYPCWYCKMDFRTNHDVIAHTKKQHVLSPQDIVCERCAKVSSSPKAYKTHSKSCLPADCADNIQPVNVNPVKDYPTVEEPIPDFSNLTPVQISRNKFKCPICYKTILKSGLQAHINITHNEQRPFPCPHCDYKAKTPYRLKTHIEKIHRIYGHETKLFACPSTPQSTSSPTPAKLYKQSAESPLFPCDLCDYLGLTEERVIAHKKKSHGEGREMIPCTHCSELFPDKHILSQHIRDTHDTEGKTYRRKLRARQDEFSLLDGQDESAASSEVESGTPKAGQNQTQHEPADQAMKRDSLAKVFSCPECSSDFESKYRLMKHRTAEHGYTKALFKCDKCTKGNFSSEETLRIHKDTIHGVGQSLVCSQCHKEFVKTSTLKNHMIHIHSDFYSTSSTPFGCHKCGLAFSDVAGLLDHVYVDCQIPAGTASASIASSGGSSKVDAGAKANANESTRVEQPDSNSQT